MPLFTLTKFYSRQQGSTTFNFYYSANKQLVAEIVRDGNTQQLQVDIPRDFQTDLDEAKRNKLKTMFDQSYFGIQREKLLVNARGLGGWNEDVHKGYTVVSGQVQPSNDYGTYQLALNVDFRDSDAKIIADACQAVDQGKTGPYPGQTPGRHFDENGNTWENWATENDSRMRYISTAFEEAMQLKREGKNRQSLRILGTGLHSLQDMFAHTPDFSIPLNPSAAVHGHGADKVNQDPVRRISMTKEATQLYLRAFHDDMDLDVLMHKIAEFRQHPPRSLSPVVRYLAPPAASAAGAFVVGAIGFFVGGPVGLLIGGGLGLWGGARVILGATNQLSQ